MKDKVLIGILVYFCLLVLLSFFVSTEFGVGTFCGTSYSCSSIDSNCRHLNTIIYSTDDFFQTYISICSLKNPSVFSTYLTRPVYALSYFFYALQFGFNYFTPRIMNSLFSVGVLILTYLLSKRFIKDKLLSVLPVVLVGLHPLYILLSVSGFTDIMFMFFVLLGINLWYQKDYKLSTIVISLTPLIRPEGFALLIWWGILNFRKGWKNILLLGIPIGLYFLGDFILFGDSLHYVKYPFLMSIGNWYYNPIVTIFKYISVYGIPLTIFFLFGFLKNLNKKHVVVIGCMLSIFLAQNFGYLTGVHRFFERYALLSLPFAVLYMSLFIENLSKYLDVKIFNSRFRDISIFGKRIRFVLVVLIIVYMFSNLVHVVDNQYCENSRRTFHNLSAIEQYLEKIERLSLEYNDIYIHRTKLIGFWFNFGDLPLVDTKCDLMNKNLVPCYGIKVDNENVELYDCYSFDTYEFRNTEEPKIFRKSECDEELCIDENSNVFVVTPNLLITLLDQIGPICTDEFCVDESGNLIYVNPEVMGRGIGGSFEGYYSNDFHIDESGKVLYVNDIFLRDWSIK